MELDSLAALVNRQAADLDVYAGFLIGALEGALPAGYVEVERKGSMFGSMRGRKGDVLSVAVRLGEQRFVLSRPRVGAPVESTIAHEVGGIVLSRRAVALGVWSDELARSLAQLAASNEQAAASLQRLTSFNV